MSPTDDILVKDPVVRGALALYPLFRTGPTAPAYLTGPEAERLGVLRVAEHPGGATVPELMVHNTGVLPLLLLEGETLVGAKQNRTLDASVLVPAGSAAPIAVSCVEAGRWGAPRSSARSNRHAPLDLRRVKTSNLAVHARRARKQEQVWDRIARYESELGAASPTRALEDVAASRTADVSTLVTGIRPLPEQCGVVVAVGSTLRGVDCFDKPASFVAYWDALVAGYALDAVAAPSSGSSGSSEPPALPSVEALLTRVRAAERAPVHTTGLGNSATFADGQVVGSELRWDDVFVHISAFVDETLAP